MHVRISEIALSSGFSDLSWFNASFRRAFGATPKDVRSRGPGRRLFGGLTAAAGCAADPRIRYRRPQEHAGRSP